MNASPYSYGSTLVPEHPILINFRNLPTCPNVFRSSCINLTGENGIKYLAKEIGIQTYIDFRNKREQKYEFLSNQLAHHNIKYLNYEISDYEGNLKLNPTPAVLDYIDYYERILRQGKNAFRSFLTFMAKNGNKNVVFACYSGKDRTGIAAILLLHVLNVSKVTIKNDFFATNDELTRSIFAFQKNWTKRGLTADTYLKRIQIQEAAFDLLLERFQTIYGGIDQYISNELNITTKEIELICTK